MALPRAQNVKRYPPSSSPDHPTRVSETTFALVCRCPAPPARAALLRATRYASVLHGDPVGHVARRQLDGKRAPATFAGLPCCATLTRSPSASESGGLLMMRSAGVRPLRTLTSVPRLRPSATCLRTTLSPAPSVATFRPCCRNSSALVGMCTTRGSAGRLNAASDR
jgi:hypothetical protein